MTIANQSDPTHAATGMLDGESNTDARDENRINQAVVAAAQQLQHAYEGKLDSKRLDIAMELALCNGVTLNLDDSSSVQSGQHLYRQKDGTCSCPDHQQRGTFCKHLMAAHLYRLARALLSSEPASKLPEPPAVLPDLPASAQWDVKEAPVSVCLKLRFGRGEVTYTMRAVTDAEAEARVQTRLAFIDRLEDAYQSRQAARAEAAQAARAEASQTAPAKTPTRAESLVEAEPPQKLVQQAVPQARGQADAQNGSGNQPLAVPPTARTPEASCNDQGDRWCCLHEAWMPERSNASGSWHSHPAEDEEGRYYCKGQGRSRPGSR